MTGEKAPGGHIYRVSPDGKRWDLVSIGFRNPFDIAFNRDGELFTYDSDMEWDVNTPWYRPTRVLHVASGSEFGYRNGAGKWPAYTIDSLPAVADVGPGSPTGVTFGYGARFPAKYQEALYLCDWSYGKLYAAASQAEGLDLQRRAGGVPGRHAAGADRRRRQPERRGDVLRGRRPDDPVGPLSGHLCRRRADGPVDSGRDPGHLQGPRRPPRARAVPRPQGAESHRGRLAVPGPPRSVHPLGRPGGHRRTRTRRHGGTGPWPNPRSPRRP